MIAWVSRQGGVVIHATRDFTVKTVQKAADLAMQAGRRLYTDIYHRSLQATNPFRFQLRAPLRPDWYEGLKQVC